MSDGSGSHKNFPLISGMRVDGNRIRKEKVANSKLSAYVWTGPKIKFKNNDRLSPKLTVSAKILIIFIRLYFESL